MEGIAASLLQENLITESSVYPSHLGLGQNYSLSSSFKQFQKTSFSCLSYCWQMG